MVEEGVLTRTETANRGMHTLVAWGLQETAIPELVEFNTGRMAAQTRPFPERVSNIGIMGGGSIGKADSLRYYLAGYERVLNESPQVRHRARIIGRNLDADAMGAAPGVAFNNPALDVMGIGSPDPIQSRYMQQLPTRSEGIVGAWHVFETPPDASPGQSVAGDSLSAEAPVRYPMNWLPETTFQTSILIDRALAQENQTPGLNFWSGIVQGISGTAGRGRILEVSEKFLDHMSSLNDLKEALNSAAEEGGIIPPQHTVDQARTIIRGLHSKAPRRYSVYLMPNGAIAIDTRGRKPDGALLTVNEDGTVCHSGEKDGQRWHRDYVDQAPLSDPNLLMELSGLG